MTVILISGENMGLLFITVVLQIKATDSMVLIKKKHNDVTLTGIAHNRDKS